MPCGPDIYVRIKWRSSLSPSLEEHERCEEDELPEASTHVIHREERFEEAPSECYNEKRAEGAVDSVEVEREEESDARL